MRIFRILKVMRFFSDLRTMLFGILNSMKSLMWCMVILLMLMFMFGMAFMQLSLTHLQDQQQKGIPIDIEDDNSLPNNFGGMWRTIYTLYKSILGGMDWGDAAGPLMEIHPAPLPQGLVGILYCTYIGFASLCVLNIVTGVFVDNANRIIQNDMEHMIMEEMETETKWKADVGNVFLKAAGVQDTGQSTKDVALTLHQFKNFIKDKAIQAYLRKMGLNVDNHNAKHLFSLLDFDQNGSLHLTEFVEGCSEVVGTARQLDIARLKYDSKAMRKQLAQILEFLYVTSGRKHQGHTHTQRRTIHEEMPNRHPSDDDWLK